MIRITQSIETNVNVLATSPMTENIISILEDMPFSCFKCESVGDVFMIPCFMWFLDGRILTKDNKAIEDMECFLNWYHGELKKCPQCERYDDCIKDGDVAKLDMGMPKHKAPAILLHADKKQREVESLISLIPPMPVTEPFSSELVEWIQSTCLVWQKKALKWRVEYEQWCANMLLQLPPDMKMV
jgi:hypothetical protein